MREIRIFESMGLSGDTSREIRDTLTAGQAGGCVTIKGNMMRKAFDEGAAQVMVSEDRAAQLDPDMNRPYRILCAALEGRSTQVTPIFSTIGLLALMIDKGAQVYLDIRAFTRHPMAAPVVAQLRKDVDRGESFCGLFYNDGMKEHLLGIYYPNTGILAAAAGLAKKTVKALDVPYLTWQKGQAIWDDPMEHGLSKDSAARLLFMLERVYPVQKYPGLGRYMDRWSKGLSSAKRLRLQEQIKVKASPEVIAFIGSSRMADLTPPDCGIPEVFAPMLGIMQQRSGAQALSGHLCGEVEVKGRKVLAIPPLTCALLDDPAAVLSTVSYTSCGKGVQVDVVLHYEGDRMQRSRVYTYEEMLDVTTAPSIVQNFHMAGVTDEVWNGRNLIVTGIGAVNAHDLEVIEDIQVAEFGAVECCVRANGQPMEGYLLSSDMAAWAVYLTGSETRYVTLTDRLGNPLVNLLTTPARCTWEQGLYSGKALLAVDCGTTRTNVSMVIDDSVPQPERLTLTVRADEISQPITPMSGGTFGEICAMITQRDMNGPLHPTAIEYFRTAESPAALAYPGVSARLLGLDADTLDRIARDGAAARAYALNMKGRDTAGTAAESQRNAEAYVMAMASFIQLGYLWLLSRGQKKIRVLIAYPRGLGSTRLFDQAIRRVEANLPAGTIEKELVAESFAAGEYIRTIRPEALPINRSSNLMVVDLGGTTVDIDVSRGGVSEASNSFAYASNLSQLSALLALLRKPHGGATGKWNRKNGLDILQSIFGGLVSRGGQPARVPPLVDTVEKVMAMPGKNEKQTLIYNEHNRKLLEELFRSMDWAIDPSDSFTQHWLELWSLPIIELLAASLQSLAGEAVYTTFVGAGSIFLNGLLRSDSGFSRRVHNYLMERSGVRALSLTFAGSREKPEVAHGMLLSVLRGTVDHAGPPEREKDMICRLLEEGEAHMPEGHKGLAAELERLRRDPQVKLADVRRFAGSVVAASITEQRYHDFVAELMADELVEREEEPQDSFGLGSVYELLRYTPATLDGFDDFGSIVQDVLERFPGIANGGVHCARMLLYMVAFEVANRNLLNLQCTQR